MSGSFVVVVSMPAISGNHNDYIQYNDHEKRQEILWRLFSEERDHLTLTEANNHLSNGQGTPEDGVNFEIVISLKDFSFLRRLNTNQEKAVEQFRDAIREALTEMFEDLGARNVRWTGAIQLNTDQPHAHICVAPDCIDIKTGNRRILSDIPRQWKFLRKDVASRAASYFEQALQRRFNPLAPQITPTIPPTYSVRQTLPAKARDDEAGREAQQRVQTYLTDEKEISPSIVEEQFEAGSIYASQDGLSVFLHRDADGNVKGATVRGKVIGDEGHFFIGNLRTATRYVFVDTPSEALSLYDLTRAKDLSRAAFVALPKGQPSASLLRLIATRDEDVRVVWALGLSETGEQKCEHLEETRTRLQELAADELVEHAIEIIAYPPDRPSGGTWNGKLNNSHVRAELSAIENPADTLQPVIVERRETDRRLTERAEETTTRPDERAEAVLPSAVTTGRTISAALSSLPVVRTLPVEDDVLDGTRAFNQREKEREAARQKRAEEDRARADAAQRAMPATRKESAKVETNTLRQIPLEDVLHAHGLRLRDYNGEKVYLDGERRFVIKVSNDLFSDRKDSLLGGKGAIDLVMHLQGVDFKTARTWLTDFIGGDQSARLRERAAAAKEIEDKPKPLGIHPANNENLEIVRNYLINERGLSTEIVEYSIRTGILYANSMKSCVFVHRDSEGHITGGEWRSTETHMRGTMSGTEKQFGWFYLGDMRAATRYVLVEAPIDLLSYIELHQDEDISQTCFVSLNGASAPRTLLEFIANRTRETEKVELVWAVDNNPLGAKSREAAEKSFARTVELLDSLETGLLVQVQRQEPQEKDWNDQLRATQGKGAFTVEDRSPAPAEQQQPVEQPQVLERPNEPDAPNAIKAVRALDSVIADFVVEFNDGRMTWRGRAEDAAHAQELATVFRETITARGTEVNENGVYREDVSYVVLPFPKASKVQAHISVVEDAVDGRWRIGITAQAGLTGWSYAPSVFGESFESRALALRTGAASLRRSFAEQAARSDTSERERQELHRAINLVKEFEATQAQTSLPGETVQQRSKRAPQSEQPAESVFDYFKIVRSFVSDEGTQHEAYWSTGAWPQESLPEESTAAGGWTLIRGDHFASAEEASETASVRGLKDYSITGYRVPEMREGAQLSPATLSRMPEDELIFRMENAPDFAYDDEERELNRRLAARGLDWRWTTKSASIGRIHVIEAYPLRSHNEQSLESDGRGEGVDAGIQGAVGEDGRRLSGRTEAAGVPAIGRGGQPGDALPGDGGRDGTGAADAAGEGRAARGSVDRRAGTDASSLTGAGAMGDGGAGGRDSESRGDVADREQAGDEPRSARELIYARITNDAGMDGETRSRAYHEAVRAAEASGLIVSGRYASGTVEQVRAATEQLETSSTPASFELLTDPDELLLARTNGHADWELPLADFSKRRHIEAINSYRRAITRNQEELKGLSGRSTKRQRELSEQIRLWQRVVDDPARHLEGNRNSYEKTYESIVRNAISKGFTVPREIVESNPLFRTAADARERYEKGRHTSFGNKSGIIDDSMQAERGFKCKRQDGRQITPEQVREITAAMDEIESVIGSVRDIMRQGDVTIAHTNGKRPFLSSDAGGMYHPTERTITTGTRNRITGSSIPVEAHEFAHFLDDEAGAALNLEVRVFNSGGRRSSRMVRYLSEADNRYHRANEDENLLADARSTMIYSREVERILNLKDKHAERDVLVAREYLSIRLGHYYKSPREIWARLFEQYISTKLEGSAQVAADQDYTNTLGFWKREDFERLMPRIEKQIARRLQLVRAALNPEAALSIEQVEAIDSINAEEQSSTFQPAHSEVSAETIETESVSARETAPTAAHSQQSNVQSIPDLNPRSESEVLFEQLLEAMPVGTSFEIAGEGEEITALAGRWVRVAEEGRAAWRTELAGELNGHYRLSRDFYAIGVGNVQAETNTLIQLVESAEGGIELLEQASIEAEYRAQSNSIAPAATTPQAADIPIADGLRSESAYHRWLRSTHGCDHLQAQSLSLSHQTLYRVQYLAARARGEAPAQIGEDPEPSAHRERLESSLPQAIMDDARYHGQKVSELSIRAQQRLRGIMDALNSLDNKLTIEQPRPVVELVEIETPAVSAEVRETRGRGRAIVETLQNGDLIVEPSGNRWRVANVSTNSPNTTIAAGLLECENNRLASIIIRDPRGNYLANNAELFAADSIIHRVSETEREQTEISKLPQESKAHVETHLARLRAADEQLRSAQAEDERTGTGTKQSDETWQQLRSAAHESRRALTDFITSAMQLGVDGSEVIEELGGFPQLVKARMMQDDQAAQDAREIVPPRTVIDATSIEDAREREGDVEPSGQAAPPDEATSHWERGDWPEVDENAFFESPYGSQEDDPYVMLNESVRLQVQRKFFIPLAAAALERDVDPATGKTFRERARKQFEHDLLEARHSYEATFDEVDAVMGRACGAELRRRVAGLTARNVEQLIIETVRELSENDEARTIFERNRRDPQNCRSALTRFAADHVSGGLSVAPSPVEVAEYNIALTTPDFFSTVGEKLHLALTDLERGLSFETQEVRTSAPASDELTAPVTDEAMTTSLPAGTAGLEHSPQIEAETERASDLVFLRVVVGTGEPSAEYEGFYWKQMASDQKLWYGPEEYLDWMTGQLESGMFKVERIDERTFRTLTDQLDDECYDRRGWPQIEWDRFYQSSSYYSSEEPDPYLALDASLEMQIHRTRTITDGEESLRENIDPKTGKAFKAKDRESFVKSLARERSEYDGLFLEVAATLGDVAECELRARVEASVGPLPAPSVQAERAATVEETSAPEVVQESLFGAALAETSVEESSTAPTTIGSAEAGAVADETVDQQQEIVWDWRLNGTRPGDQFLLINQETGAPLMRVEAEADDYSKYLRLRVLNILAKTESDLQLVENYLETPINHVREAWSEKSFEILLDEEETHALKPIKQSGTRREKPITYRQTEVCGERVTIADIRGDVPMPHYLEGTGINPALAQVAGSLADGQYFAVGHTLFVRVDEQVSRRHYQHFIPLLRMRESGASVYAHDNFERHTGAVPNAALAFADKLRNDKEAVQLLVSEIDDAAARPSATINTATSNDALQQTPREKSGQTLKQWENPNTTYWRVGGLDERVGISLGYERDEVEQMDVVRLRFADDSTETFAPASIFPAQPGEVRAFFGNEAAREYNDLLRASGSSLAEQPPEPETATVAVDEPEATGTSHLNSEIPRAAEHPVQTSLFDLPEEMSAVSEVMPPVVITEVTQTEAVGEELLAPVIDERPAINTEELAAELAARVAEAEKMRAARGPNYIIEDPLIHNGGAKTRFKWNVEAIETLRLIEAEERQATAEEKQILARFSGFGSMPGAFNRYSDDAGQWTKERDQIKRLLTEEEYEAAARSTLNAHFTHPAIADAMWTTVKRMGFEGGRVLEPAMGSGIFFGRLPQELRERVQLTGVELDHLTGRISKLLYPQADIHNIGYQNFDVPNGWFDLVISNVPFGKYNVHDPDYNKYNANIHEYFLLKSLDKVREGGLVVCITSTFTLDKQDSRIREKLAEKADLVAAVRLPETAFQKNAGTEVVTDILFLQKRAPLEKRLAYAEKILRQQEEIAANAQLKLQRAGNPDVYLASVYRQASEDADHAKKQMERAQAEVEQLKAGGTNGVNWMKVVPVEDPAGGEPIPVNEYYAENPEMIVGILDRSGSMYHDENVTVHLQGNQDLDRELHYALRNVPSHIFENEPPNLDAGGIEKLVTHNDKIKAGGLVVEDGVLYRRVRNVLVKQADAAPERLKRCEKLLHLRDTVRTLFNHELAGELDAATEVRARLNREYNQFTVTYGYLHSPKNQQALAGDPDLPLLLALEKDYTPGTSRKPARAVKADIFTKPTLRSYQRPEKANNINEALSITLNEYGRLHLDRLCELLNKDRQTVGDELLASGLAYQDRGLVWVTRDEYLSGNVRAKLNEAREAAKTNPRFEAGVKALENVIPKDVDHVEIGVRLGSSWVPADDVADFLAHLVGGERSDFNVKYAALTGSWSIGYSKEGAAKHRFKPAAVEIWGTDRADLIDIVQHACDARAVVVRDKIDKDKYIVNKEETEAANAKVAAVKQEFKEWIWTDHDRADRLHRYYNDNFNNIAPKNFDGSHLTFPGMNPAIKLRQNQVDAIWRTITSGKAIYAHKVGRGKTYTYIAAAMEMKRLGLVEKPAIACLKGNIGEVTAAAHKLYPGIRVLSTLGNFEKAQRKEIVAQMATGDYDLIILTHDNLDMLPMYPETRAKYIKEELKELEETIYAAALNSGKDSNRLVKTLEIAKAKLEADMLEILEKNKDDAVNFEETGIDFLFVDEFHKYKSLKVYTKQDRVKGIPQTRSDRATNMLARIRWLLEQHDGRGAVAGTGTPLSNTTAELFNLQRYFQWDELNERGIRSFDAWASVFGETVTKIERTATGSYKEVTRFAKFTNLPELIQLVHQVMDVCMEDVPEIKLPKRIDEVVTSELSHEQQSYLGELQFRAENLKGKYIKEKGADNMLAISNDARKMSLDMRLVSPYASDDQGNKVNNCVRDVLQNLKERPDITQLIFSDMGVNANDWGFSVYQDLREKLIAGGLKPEEVIDFSKLTEKARKQAIADLATGKAKVGIGSTDKLGTGTNVQYHLYANHNLDVHWLPSAQLQRDGRAERQGNKHADLEVPIRIKRYVTVGSFDEIMYSAVDRKINFINQIMRGDVNGIGREFVEVDGEELTAAQIAAIASGNPDVLRKVELEEEVGQLERSERRHRQAQIRLDEDAREMVSRRAMHESNIEKLQVDVETLRAATTDEKGQKREGFQAEVQGKEYSKRSEASAALERAFSSSQAGDRLGTYKGFPIVSHEDFAFGSLFRSMYLVGDYDHYQVNYATTDGIFTSMDASLRNIEKLIVSNQEQIRVLDTNGEKITQEIGKPFKDAERLKELRDELVAVEKRLRAAGVADGTNVKTGKIAFQKYEHEVELRNEGVVKELRRFAKNGGTLIRIDKKPVGWLKQDDEGALVALEIKEEYRRHGVATRAIHELYQSQEFKCHPPDEQGAPWLQSVGEHEVDEETGLLTVKPYPLPTIEEEQEESAVIVGYQTRIFLSKEEEILRRYAEETRQAEEGYRELTGYELSAGARHNLGRMILECANQQPTAEQEEMIKSLMDKEGFDERPASIRNQVDAASWIARRTKDAASQQIWVRAALSAAQGASSTAATASAANQTTDVGKYHRGRGADRSYGVALALDRPISREETHGRETVDVRYVTIPKEKIFDPQGLIRGTNVEQSQMDLDALASRLVAVRIERIQTEEKESAPQHVAEKSELDEIAQESARLRHEINIYYESLAKDVAGVARERIEKNLSEREARLTTLEERQAELNQALSNEQPAEPPILSVNVAADATDATARERTRILKDLGYAAEARSLDNERERAGRELIVFDLGDVRTIERDVAPEMVAHRAAEWKERATIASKEDAERPARLASWREFNARYRLAHADYRFRAAVEQTDFRRYKVLFKGEQRKLSVRDVQKLARAQAHRQTARVFEAELAKQEQRPVGERKSARVLRMELEEQFTARELEQNDDVLTTLRAKHEEKITELESELVKARSAYEDAVERAVEESDEEGKVARPLARLKDLDELHDEAVDRRDTEAILALDRLRQNLIAEKGDEMQRADHTTARLAAQYRMAELDERSSRNYLSSFEETSHLRRFVVAGANRPDYLPESMNKAENERHEDHTWSLKDVAKARKTVEMSHEWLSRNALHYEGNTSFMKFLGRLADQHFNPLTRIKMEGQIITDPKQYLSYHLNPLKQLESNPLMQTYRFVKNYHQAAEQAAECRRLAELEAQKLAALDEVEMSVKEQIADKRLELQTELAEQTELRTALEASIAGEISHRAARGLEMAKPAFEDYEIKQLGETAMQLQDGELLREYEAEALAAQAEGLLEEERLPMRALGRETVAESRLINAEQQRDVLNKEIEMLSRAGESETELVRVRELMPVRVEIEGEDEVLSLRDVAESTEEVQQAVAEALSVHETRLAGEAQKAKEFYEATSEITESYRAELEARGLKLDEPQFSIKEHLQIEQFAAGVEDDALHERFSEIAQSALDDGRVIGIDQTLAQSFQTGMASGLAQTPEFEKTLAAGNEGVTKTAMNALSRSVGIPDAASVGQNQVGEALQPGAGLVETPALGNPSAVLDVSSPTAINDSSSVTDAEAAQVAEAAEADDVVTEILDLMI